MSTTLKAIVVACVLATPALAVPFPEPPSPPVLACQLFVGAAPLPAFPTPVSLRFRGQLADCHTTGVIDAIAVNRAWLAPTYNTSEYTPPRFPTEWPPTGEWRNWIKVNGEATWPAETITFVDDELTWTAVAEILAGEPLQLAAPLPRPRPPVPLPVAQPAPRERADDQLARDGERDVNRELTRLCRERPLEALAESTRRVVRGGPVPWCFSRQLVEQQRAVSAEQGFTVVTGAIAAPFVIFGDLITSPFRERW